MKKLTIYEVLEFIDWLKPTLKLIERNNMYTKEREEVFKVLAERIGLLVERIDKEYQIPQLPNDPGVLSWLKKLHELEDTRDEKEND